MTKVGKDLHVLTLVGIRPDKSTQTFYRWAFQGTAATLAVEAFDKAIGVGEIVKGFASWHLECACEWMSASAERPHELAGLGFIHLLTSRLDRS
ncbi:MAG TPA: hypothetical protein VIS26_02985 [Candidatus Limnocylindria bacterium]